VRPIRTRRLRRPQHHPHDDHNDEHSLGPAQKLDAGSSQQCQHAGIVSGILRRRTRIENRRQIPAPVPNGI
jgi:hypothetical protein